MKIEGISPSLKYLIDQPKPLAEEKVSFGELLEKHLDKVNQEQLKVDEMTKGYIAGEDIELYDVMLAAENASLSFQFTVQVKNKIVEAYQEIARMQI